jgi:hypothetical protein
MFVKIHVVRRLHDIPLAAACLQAERISAISPSRLSRLDHLARKRTSRTFGRGGLRTLQRFR